MNNLERLNIISSLGFLKCLFATSRQGTQGKHGHLVKRSIGISDLSKHRNFFIRCSHNRSFQIFFKFSARFSTSSHRIDLNYIHHQSNIYPYHHTTTTSNKTALHPYKGIPYKKSPYTHDKEVLIFWVHLF